MNKKEFMKKLKQLLPEKDKRDILLDYEEHFLSGLTDGKTEEEIVSELGTPEEVAREFGYTGKAPITYSVWAAVGIIAFDIFIGIWLLITLIATCMPLWAIPLSCFISGLGLIVSTAFAHVWAIPWYFMLTSGLSLLGFSVLSGVGMVYVTKGCYLAVKWYVMLHAKIFSGR